MKNKKTNCKIVLASGSPRRVEMLKNLGLQFEVLPADVDETVKDGALPQDVVLELALSKAERVESILKGRLEMPSANQAKGTSDAETLIIAADTVVALGGAILGKPVDRDDAIRTLTTLSGKPHQVFTGVCYLLLDSDYNRISMTVEADETEVFFRELTSAEIESYVDTGEPMDKAGAYALQGIGAFMVSRINGCAANVKGLPTPLVVQKLRELGLTVMGS